MQIPAFHYLFASGEHRYMSASSLIAAGSNLGLSLSLVTPLGLIGVALGTFIPQLIQHQGFIIRKACQTLHVSTMEYITTVHLKNSIPLLTSLALVLSLKEWVPLGSMPLVGIGWMSAIALLLGSVLWYQFATSAEEKAFAETHIFSPIKIKFRRQMEVFS